MKKELKDIHSTLVATYQSNGQLNMAIVEILGHNSILGKPFNFVYKSDRAQRGVPQPIDLGLSVLWASQNYGAPSEEQPGYYVGWGDITAENYSSIYDEYPCPNPPMSICGSKFDIARLHWNESWRYPTVAEMQELMQECFWEWVEVHHLDGSLINGFRVTGKNNNSIFLPASGNRYGSEYENINEIGRYWCGEIDPSDTYRAYLLEFYQDGGGINSLSRFLGLLIRPVLNKE